MTKEINLMAEKTEEKGGYQETALPSQIETITLKKENEQRFHMKRVIEALLFASTHSLSFKKIKQVLSTIDEIKPAQLQNLIEELKKEYSDQGHAFGIEEIAEGYVLRSRPEYSEYLELLFDNKKVDKISSTATEVLAIIAYRQPITKPQIEEIRGIDSSNTVSALLERGLIEPKGKLDAPGKPTLYGTTEAFLIHYGLQNLDELPKQEIFAE